MVSPKSSFTSTTNHEPRYEIHSIGLSEVVGPIENDRSRGETWRLAPFSLRRNRQSNSFDNESAATVPQAKRAVLFRALSDSLPSAGSQVGGESQPRLGPTPKAVKPFPR